MDLEASGCQRRSDPKEGKEETRLNDLGSENLEREDLQVTTSRTLPFLGRTVYEGFEESWAVPELLCIIPNFLVAKF